MPPKIAHQLALKPCVSCSQRYDTATRKPRLLGCKHNLCDLCFMRLTRLYCPTCSTPINDQKFDVELIDLIEKKRREKENRNRNSAGPRQNSGNNPRNFNANSGAGNSGAQPVNKKMIYVKNLERDINNERLNDMFTPFGRIVKAWINMKNGTSQGFGFVEFEREEAANLAISVMDSKLLGSKRLYVSYAQRKEDRQDQLNVQHKTMQKAVQAPRILSKINELFPGHKRANTISEMMLEIKHNELELLLSNNDYFCLKFKAINDTLDEALRT